MFDDTENEARVVLTDTLKAITGDSLSVVSGTEKMSAALALAVLYAPKLGRGKELSLRYIINGTEPRR